VVIDGVLAIDAAVREEAYAGLSLDGRALLMQTLAHTEDNLSPADETMGAAAE
jgi:hypothetical protein